MCPPPQVDRKEQATTKQGMIGMQIQFGTLSVERMSDPRFHFLIIASQAPSRWLCALTLDMLFVRCCGAVYELDWLL